MLLITSYNIVKNLQSIIPVDNLVSNYGIQQSNLRSLD